MKKINFTVPKDYCEKVKLAMFEAGAGKYENYDRQCWQTLGQATFRPLPGANPQIGKLHQLETVDEYKVEMFCEDEFVEAVIKAMKNVHPYEGPQFEIYTIENSLAITRKPYRLRNSS